MLSSLHLHVRHYRSTVALSRLCVTKAAQILVDSRITPKPDPKRESAYRIAPPISASRMPRASSGRGSLPGHPPPPSGTKGPPQGLEAHDSASVVFVRV